MEIKLPEESLDDLEGKGILKEKQDLNGVPNKMFLGAIPFKTRVRPISDSSGDKIQTCECNKSPVWSWYSGK